eukprot:gene17476-19223_t
MREYFNNTPPPPDNNDEDDEIINEEDAVEIIEIEDDGNEDGLLEDVEDLGLEEGDVDDDDDEDEMIEIQDDSVASFTQHSGSVFSVDVNPVDSSIAASGGEDDKAFLWKVDNGDVIKELTGHKDSVHCVEFSHNGKYLATVDMAGLVQVWLTSDASLSWSFECSDVEWMHWHTAALVLFAGTTDGDIYMWKVPSGDCKILSGSGQKTTAGCVLQNGKQIFAGYEDGSLLLWDLKSASPSFTLKSRQDGHSDTVTCVASSANSALLLSGSNDSTIKLMNTSNGKVITTFQASFHEKGDDHDESQQSTSIECVAFSNDMMYILSGSLSGVLAVWDISAQRLRHKCKHPNEAGITALSVDLHQQCHVFTAALDGIVRLWDFRSGQCIKQWHGHMDTVLDLKISKTDQMIITSSDDGTAKVFKY